MHRQFILIISILSIISLAATARPKEEGIRGRIVDAATGKVIDCVTVSAVYGNNKAAATAISRQDGQFDLTPPRNDTYTVYFSFVGYGTRSQQVVFTGKSIDLGDVALSAGVDIEEVIVAARPLVRRHGDRIVFDVGNDPDAKRMKMMEIMKKIPALGMDPATGNLKFENSPIKQITFDGRQDGMINGNRQYPMELIRADYMTRIEVILPESPENDSAEPIINISLARPLPDGIAGQISPDANTRGTYSANVDLVTKTRLIGIGANYKGQFIRTPELTTSIERYDLTDDNSERYLSLSGSSSHEKGFSHNIGMNLFRPLAKDRINIGASIYTSFGNSNSLTESYADFHDRDGNVTSRSNQHSDIHTQEPASLGCGVSFYHTLSRRNRYSITYSYSDNRSNVTHNADAFQSFGTNGSRQHILNAMGTFRPENRRSDAMLMVGAGYFNRLYDNSSEYMLLDPATGAFTPDPSRSNTLEYRQQVAYTRLRYTNSLLKKRSLKYKIGLYAELLDNHGTFISDDNTPLDYRQTNLMPEAQINYSPKRLQTLLGYSTRVKRPGIQQLNSYVDDSDPMNVRVGNPELKGEYAHRWIASLGYRFNSKWFNAIGASYRAEYVNNRIESLTSIDSDNRSTTSYFNLGHSMMQDISLALTVNPIAELMVVTVTGSYTTNEFSLPSGEINRIQTAGMVVNADLSFKRFPKISVNYKLEPAFRSAQSRQNTYYSTLDLLVSNYFHKIKMGGSIWVSDLLHSNKSLREVISADNFIQYAMRQRIGRSIQISFYWRFGKFRQGDTDMIKGETYDSSVPAF